MSKQTSALSFRPHLQTQNGHLTIDGVQCEKLANQYGTPLYVVSEPRIRCNYRSFNEALLKLYKNVLVCPAVKANSHLAVLRTYKAEGAGAEGVSPAELRFALDAGFDPAKIIYNGPVKKREDLEFAISSDIGLINADSLLELDRMQEAAEHVRKRCNVGIRINLGIESETHPHLATASREHKFGTWVEDAVEAYRVASRKSMLNIVGFHSHIGSNIAQPYTFRDMTEKILRIVKEVNEAIGVRLKKVDIGGGLGFPYQPGSRSMSYEGYASAVLNDKIDALKELGEPTLIFEPGRAIVADAGILLTRVEVVKRQGTVNWGIVDAGMNTFIRPALYGAQHQVLVANKPSEPPTETYDLGGPCCESGDVIGKSVSLPKLVQGDLLAVLDVGAYGFSMSSNYNGQPRPAVVMTNDAGVQLVRRRETYEDLVAGETIPAHLA